MPANTPEQPELASPPARPRARRRAAGVVAAPIAAKDRIRALDVVRGFALLGILVPNIVAFGWPSSAMADPSIMNAQLGENPWNAIGHDITSIFTLGKMMALFSMLFGAGVVIYARKFDGNGEGVTHTCERCNHDLSGLVEVGATAICPECGRSQRVPRRLKLSTGASLWYRRTAWLLAFGFAHAVFLWFGDILVWYSMSAFAIVWWVRRWNPKLQIGLGLGLHLLSTVLMLVISAFGLWAVQQGKISADEMMGDATLEMSSYTGSYLDTFKARIPSVLMFWLFLGPMFTPGVTGLMMIGMGLTRMGILTGQRPTRLYAWMAILGIGGGLGLTATLYYGIESAWPDGGLFLWQSVSQFVGIPISLGYMGLLIWLVRIGIGNWITGLLANVGRMALSNYLLHTIACTTFFYGYGGGYFAKIDYPGLFAVVGAVWVLNIVFSALWLKAFRFGPAEWLWRSLTYWKLQPLLR